MLCLKKVDTVFNMLESTDINPFICVCVCSVAQSRLSLCDPRYCSPPGYSIHGKSQARLLKRVAIPPPGIHSWPPSNSETTPMFLFYQNKYPINHNLPTIQKRQAALCITTPLFYQSRIYQDDLFFKGLFSNLECAWVDFSMLLSPKASNPNISLASYCF